VTAAAVLGAGVGLGLIGLFASSRRRRPVLAAALSVLDREPGSSTPGETGPEISGHDPPGVRGSRFAAIGPENAEPRISRLASLRRRARHRAVASLAVAIERAPELSDRMRGELACADCSLEDLAEQCVLAFSAGALLPLVAWSVLSLEGVAVPLSLPVWVGLLGGIAGATMPLVLLRSRAAKGRRRARKAIGCFLDLVVLSLAGGLGVEGALHASAAVCDTPTSRRVARALGEARDAGRTPWETLADLGRQLGVSQLVELSAAVGLAGIEGARIRSTLAAKAASIRRHELADSETEANTITERLFFPGVLLLIGFLIFIGYPAVVRMTAGL
jgi:tight adherence protein C